MTVSTAIRRLWRHCRREQGNTLVYVTLLMTVFMGMLALTIDIGFLAGQHRFMQNGADAAALAAARVLAGEVSPYSSSASPTPTFPNFYTVNDAAVRAAATTIAQQNQNAGLTGRTTAFSVSLKYCVAADPSKYNYTAANDNCQATGNSWVISPTANGRVPDGAYKVSVTTNSTITTLFGGAAGIASGGQTSASANASAYIKGVCPELIRSGNIWPFTLWDQQDFGADFNSLFMLWGSANPPAPSGIGGSWKNVLDLTPPAKWCNGTSPDYAWAQGPTMRQLVPTGTSCTPNLTNPTLNFTGTDTTWNRTGYAQDTRGGCYLGNDDNPTDLATWASAANQGTIGVGMKMPLFTKGGDGGTNVSSGIYGPNNACSGTYFFSGVTVTDPAHPTWGPYRDVVAFTYNIPSGVGGHFFDSKALEWTDNDKKGSLERVTLVRLLHFRIYRDYDNANSRIFGRVISPVQPPGYNSSGCTVPNNGGPWFNGNIVRMGN